MQTECCVPRRPEDQADAKTYAIGYIFPGALTAGEADYVSHGENGEVRTRQVQ